LSDPDNVGGVNIIELEGLYIGTTSFFIEVGDCERSLSRSSKEVSSSLEDDEDGELIDVEFFVISLF